MVVSDFWFFFKGKDNRCFVEVCVTRPITFRKFMSIAKVRVKVFNVASSISGFFSSLRIHFGFGTENPKVFPVLYSFFQNEIFSKKRRKRFFSSPFTRVVVINKGWITLLFDLTFLYKNALSLKVPNVEFAFDVCIDNLTLCFRH